MIPSHLLVVTDRHGSERPLTETVRAVLDGGARWIWFRDKDLEREARRRLALALRDIVHAAGGRLTIGGDSALAADIGTDGVHLAMTSHLSPSDDLPAVIARAALSVRPFGTMGERGALPSIGVSAHSFGDVRRASEAGAGYVTLSPIFGTASKPGYGPALGLGALREAAGIGLPIIALGGIGPAEARACRDAGAAGVAVMGGLMRAADPAEETRRLIEAMRPAI